jgi:hypothetical protein
MRSSVFAVYPTQIRRKSKSNGNDIFSLSGRPSMSADKLDRENVLSPDFEPERYADEYRERALAMIENRKFPSWTSPVPHRRWSPHAVNRQIFQKLSFVHDSVPACNSVRADLPLQLGGICATPTELIFG